MRLGVQFRGTLAPRQTRRWYTHSWSDDFNVVWTVVPTGRYLNGRIEWDVEVKRQNASRLTYYIEVKNVSGVPVEIEARYAILNR